VARWSSLTSVYFRGVRESMMTEKTIGVLGGGQLGRMMGAAAHRLGLRLAILDPG
jgi:phosphoglycerate dehydrogenase-like enzyme